MEELRKQLADIINNNELPFEAKYYVVKDVFREVNDVYQSFLKQQEQQQTETEKISEEEQELVKKD